MKLSKFLFVGLLAVCASVFFSACKSDDDATSGFYVDSNPDGLKRGAGSDSASGG